MDLNRELYVLLQQRQQVCLSGLGCFTVVEQSAQVHPVNHTFTPPQSFLEFESNVEVDNVFIKHISDVFQLSEEQAANALDAFVTKVLENIEQNGSHTFEGLGTLIKSKDGNFLFECREDVVLKPALYGLQEFSSEAIKRQAAAASGKPEHTLKKSHKKSIAIAILLLFMVAFGATFFLFPQHVQPHLIHIKNSFISVKDGFLKASEKPDKFDSGEAKSAAGDARTIEEPLVDYVEEPLDDTISEDIEADLVFDGDDAAKEKPVEKKYYIVAGSFHNKDNAIGLVDQLKAEGFNDARMHDNKKRGFYIVSIVGFNASEDAQRELRKLVNEGYRDAWIMK